MASAEECSKDRIKTSVSTASADECSKNRINTSASTVSTDECYKDGTETSASTINIFGLPDEIIIHHILPLFTIREIGPVKLVCTKWLEYVQKYLRSLKVLDLTEWEFEVDEELLCSIVKYAVHLQELRLGRCWRAVTESSILTVANKCHQLQVFSAFKCGSLTDLAIIMLMKRCPKMAELDLSSCYRITDESLCNMATSAKNLRELHVSSNYGVTDYGVSQIAFKCHSLQVLDVSYCYRVSNLGLEGFLRRNSYDDDDDGANDVQCGLKYLRVKDCPKVTDTMVARLTSIGIEVNNMF
ncbi:uncharacterized protein [Amphiura filiformis]|uniref:uncharacterized protein n=1 Tax=Amphiura filiformis TaxID=82378 RepID=UPI003B210E13